MTANRQYFLPLKMSVYLLLFLTQLNLCLVGYDIKHNWPV